jgi:hypothetical protein
MPRVIGYAVDGFKIYAQDSILGDDDLDNWSVGLRTFSWAPFAKLRRILSFTSEYSPFGYAVGRLQDLRPGLDPRR